MFHPLSFFRCALVFSCFLGSSLKAATVGYWRFENSSLIGEDSGSNGLNLTNSSGVSVSTPFSNPIPQTGASNLLAVDLESDSGRYLSVADNAAFAFQDFTIEAYIRIESLSSSTTRIIASQLNTGSGASFGWQFGVSATSGSAYGNNRVFLQTSADGSGASSAITASSSFALSTNTNYYVAASANFTAGVGLTITYYLKDLTAGTDMITSSGSITSSSSLYNSTANFAVGASYSGGSAARFFDGVIDEVRLSNTVLTQSELLAVPEPSAWALLTVGGVFAGVFLRRRA